MDREEACNLIPRSPTATLAGDAAVPRSSATRRWSVTALSPTGGRRKVWRPPTCVTGEADSEVGALEDLAAKLDKGGA